MNHTKQGSLNPQSILRSNSRIVILNTVIDTLTMEETVVLTDQYIAHKIPLHLVGMNADKINKLNKDERFRQIVNNSGIVNADGAAVVVASKFLGQPLPERVAGIDLMQRLLELSEKKGYSIYLLGTKQEFVEKAADAIRKQFPQINIVGIHNGYFKEAEWNHISDQLKAVKPDLIFVGINSPTKEYLVDFLQKAGNDGVFMGVGGSLDVVAGEILRAPKWMQKMGMEWLFRFIQEPRRLFKRYFVGNVVFILAALKEKIGLLTKRKNA